LQSLDDTFRDLLARLKQGRTLGGTGTDPIYYLVFPVSEVLTVKRKIIAWRGQLQNQGYDVVDCSLHTLVRDTLLNHKQRRFWLEGEKFVLRSSAGQTDGIQTKEIATTLASALAEGPEVIQAVLAHLEDANSRTNGLLLLTDLEAIHPFLRINSIEAQLHGKVRCPVVVLYPGLREGRTSLRFLGFYPPDPNYRSEHLG
jgi:hypothetical protein